MSFYDSYSTKVSEIKSPRMEVGWWALCLAYSPLHTRMLSSHWQSLCLPGVQSHPCRPLPLHWALYTTLPSMVCPPNPLPTGFPAKRRDAEQRSSADDWGCDERECWIPKVPPGVPEDCQHLLQEWRVRLIWGPNGTPLPLGICQVLCRALSRHCHI